MAKNVSDRFGWWLVILGNVSYDAWLLSALAWASAHQLLFRSSTSLMRSRNPRSDSNWMKGLAAGEIGILAIFDMLADICIMLLTAAVVPRYGTSAPPGL